MIARHIRCRLPTLIRNLQRQPSICRFEQAADGAQSIAAAGDHQGREPA